MLLLGGATSLEAMVVVDEAEDSGDDVGSAFIWLVLEIISLELFDCITVPDDVWEQSISAVTVTHSVIQLVVGSPFTTLVLAVGVKLAVMVGVGKAVGISVV